MFIIIFTNLQARCDLAEEKLYDLQMQLKSFTSDITVWDMWSDQTSGLLKPDSFKKNNKIKWIQMNAYSH